MSWVLMGIQLQPQLQSKRKKLLLPVHSWPWQLLPYDVRVWCTLPCHYDYNCYVSTVFSVELYPRVLGLVITIQIYPLIFTYYQQQSLVSAITFIRLVHWHAYYQPIGNIDCQRSPLYAQTLQSIKLLPTTTQHAATMKIC
jgi:hypothetical protein